MRNNILSAILIIATLAGNVNAGRYEVNDISIRELAIAMIVTDNVDPDGIGLYAADGNIYYILPYMEQENLYLMLPQLEQGNGIMDNLNDDLRDVLDQYVEMAASFARDGKITDYERLALTRAGMEAGLVRSNYFDGKFLTADDLTREQQYSLEGELKEFEIALNTAGEDGQLANTDLQNCLQVNCALLQLMSNISKATHETSTATIRKIK